MAKESAKNRNTAAAKAAQKIAKEILGNNPGMREVHVTSDGMAFFTRNDAQNHANTLKNRELFSFKRSTLMAPETSGDGEADAEEVGDQNENPNTEE